jgi:hypothetical protein
VSADPAVGADQAAVDKLQSEYAAAEQTVGCEQDGTCGTHQQGNGPAVAADQLIANQYGSELNRAQAQLRLAETATSIGAASTAAAQKANAAEVLPGLRTELANLQSEQNAELEQERNLVAEATGMAARLEALWNLGLRYPEVAVLHIAIVLTLISIECTPIVTKTLTLIGSESVAERLARVHYDDLVERRREANDRQRLLDEDAFGAQRQAALEAQERVCQELLDGWAENVVADAQTNPAKYFIPES